MKKRCFKISSSPLLANVCIPPVVVTQPQSQIVDAGLSVTFSVVASGSDPKTYQWQKDGVNISGAILASHVIVYANEEDAGVYRVVVSNECGTVTSSTAVLMVNSGTCIVPLITDHPATQIVDYGTSPTFNVTVAGTEPFTYQWQKNGVNLSGETLSSLTLIYVNDASEGYYRVVITNACGSVTSAAALLMVNPQVTSGCISPNITTHPASQSVEPGTDVTFNVIAAGTAPFFYQWRKNGVYITGETLSTLSIIYAQESDEASYSVIVTNACGTVISVAALLVVENVDEEGDGGGAGGGTLDF